MLFIPILCPATASYQVIAFDFEPLVDNLRHTPCVTLTPTNVRHWSPSIA